MRGFDSVVIEHWNSAAKAAGKLRQSTAGAAPPSVRGRRPDDLRRFTSFRTNSSGVAEVVEIAFLRGITRIVAAVEVRPDREDPHARHLALEHGEPERAAVVPPGSVMSTKSRLIGTFTTPERRAGLTGHRQREPVVATASTASRRRLASHVVPTSASPSIPRPAADAGT